MPKVLIHRIPFFKVKDNVFVYICFIRNIFKLDRMHTFQEILKKKFVPICNNNIFIHDHTSWVPLKKTTSTFLHMLWKCMPLVYYLGAKVISIKYYLEDVQIISAMITFGINQSVKVSSDFHLFYLFYSLKKRLEESFLR